MSRQLPRGFMDVWDGWLQAAMHSSRKQLGDDWLDLYLSGPIWRFALSPDVCGEQAWVGVMIPSVDRVGRYFPLTVAGCAGADGNPFRLARMGDQWFQRAEDLALDMLEDDAPDFEAFEAGVEALGEPSTGDADPGVVDADLADCSACRLPLSANLDPSESYPWLLRQLLRGGGGFSLWWSDGAESVDPSLCLSAGLPLAEGFAALLSGQWADGSWQDPLGAAAASGDGSSSAATI